MSEDGCCHYCHATLVGPCRVIHKPFHPPTRGMRILPFCDRLCANGYKQDGKPLPIYARVKPVKIRWNHSQDDWKN